MIKVDAHYCQLDLQDDFGLLEVSVGLLPRPGRAGHHLMAAPGSPGPGSGRSSSSGK